MIKFYDNTELSMADSTFEQKVREIELNPLVTAYGLLMNLGVNAVEHHNQQKYIRICNFITLNTFAGSLVYLALAVFWEHWQWFGCVAALSLTCITILVLNGFGFTNVSRFTYLFAVNLVVFVNALFIGTDARIENFLIVSVIVPFLIYDIREMTMILFGTVIPVILIYSFDVMSPLFAGYYLDPGQQEILERISIIMQIVLTVAGVYQLVKVNKKAEEDLENSNAMMLMQTAELKRSNADLEQFAYIISHDLKAPVRNISSFMNLLVNKYSGSLTSEAREFVGYSHLGAKRLERLIDDVLAYCRIGTNLPKPVPVNVNDIINTIRFEMRERLTASNGVITINRELPIVNNVHSSLVYHIFQNLIGNGLKFNKSERPEITISWTNSLNYYTFSVHDNGIGISKEYSTTIFQMFKRLHNEQEYDGTGIGLAICKKIVEYYHGEIWFESEEGKGTTFYFTIRKF